MVKNSILFMMMAIMMASVSFCNVQKTGVTSAGDQHTPTVNNKNEGVIPENKNLNSDKISSEDSLFASISRSFCYGTCPVYQIHVYNSGYVLYKGIQHVEKIGTYATRLTPSEMEMIKNKALEIHYFELDDEYDSQITDVPSTTTFLQINGRKKRIKNRWGGPKKLQEYEKFFDQIFENKEWKFISEEVEEK